MTGGSKLCPFATGEFCIEGRPKNHNTRETYCYLEDWTESRILRIESTPPHTSQLCSPSAKK